MNDVASAVKAAMTPSEVLAAIVVTQLIIGAALWLMGTKFATKKQIGTLHVKIEGVAQQAAKETRAVADQAREKRHELASQTAKELARVEALAADANHKQSLLDQTLDRLGKDIGDIKSMLQEKLTVQGQHGERLAVLESRAKQRARGGAGR